MTKDAAAQEPPNALQLHSAREMRQPDKDGQIPHVFLTLSPDMPIADQSFEDILEVNWSGVKTSIQDAIVRVRHEGDLTSATVRDTIRLIALVLKKLDVGGADLERRIERMPLLGFWGWLLAPWPTASGRKLRAIARDRRSMKRQRKTLVAHHDAIFEMRIEMAEEIDKKLGSLLAAKDPEYHELLVRLQSSQADRSTAKGVLADIRKLKELEVERAGCTYENSSDSYRSKLDLKIGQIEGKMRAFVEFCHRHDGMYVKDRGDVELFVGEMAARLDAQADPIEQVMAAKRQALKQELYAEASGSAP